MNAAVIDKIRKLRALASSASVHEAAAAAAAAERLIQEHNLTEASVQVETDGDGEPVTHDVVADVGGVRIVTWQSYLLHYLGQAYQTCGFFQRKRGEGYVYKAYGRPADLATLRYQFAFFSAEITRLAALECKGRGKTFANSYRLGAVTAIAEALSTVRRETRASAVSSALVVVDRRAELAQEARDNQNPDIKTRSASTSRLDGEAYAAGKRAGARINQRGQLGANGAKLLGGGS